ncbi:DNA double-strand break repair protein Mre11 [uncultured archaeon]|nr:DNA double-strand break repair protein Mre11 [uncultured archaeon]
MFYTGFDQVVKKIIELKPDAVVHAGDVFHHVRPGIKPLYVFKQGLEKLRNAGIPVIIISGNHDAPKGYAGTSPFVIYEATKDVNIARKYEYERFEVGDHVFHCIPFCLDPSDYMNEFRNIERTGRDVLVLHGLIESLSNKKLRTVGEHELKDSLLKRDFDYIALGHYHAQARVAENAWYSGSIEYFNFGEALDEKGILLVDLESGEAEPVCVRPKYMTDCTALDCSGLSSEEIAEELLGLCGDGAIEGKIVRINLTNVNKAAYRSINQSWLNRLCTSALYLKIKVEYADEKESQTEPMDSLRLHEEFVRLLEEEATKNAIPKVIREEVMAYGTGLIKKVATKHNTEVLNAPE